MLLSRFFCQKRVRVNVRNFRTSVAITLRKISWNWLFSKFSLALVTTLIWQKKCWFFSPWNSLSYFFNKFQHFPEDKKRNLHILKFFREYSSFVFALFSRMFFKNSWKKILRFEIRANYHNISDETPPYSQTVNFTSKY